jgi:hypothetical protein
MKIVGWDLYLEGASHFCTPHGVVFKLNSRAEMLRLCQAFKHAAKPPSWQDEIGYWVRCQAISEYSGKQFRVLGTLQSNIHSHIRVRVRGRAISESMFEYVAKPYQKWVLGTLPSSIRCHIRVRISVHIRVRSHIGNGYRVRCNLKAVSESLSIRVPAGRTPSPRCSSRPCACGTLWSSPASRTRSSVCFIISSIVTIIVNVIVIVIDIDIVDVSVVVVVITLPPTTTTTVSLPLLRPDLPAE